MKKNHTLAGLSVILVIGLLIYLPYINHQFVNLDDKVQVANNLNIQSLTASSIIKIFSSTSVGMYQPFTTLFYAFAYSLGKLNPMVYHLFSILFHSMNVCLVFIILKRLDINGLKNLFLVSIFTLHPMQVESVAWISAFSNLVFTFFFLASLNQYLIFQLNEKRINYYGSLFLFVIACFSKSAAITLPVLLVVFDFYDKGNLREIKWLNKIPFFMLSLIFGIITLLSRESAGHLSDLSVQFSWFDRIFLVSHSIFFYPLKFLLPVELSVFYPYPEINDQHLPWSYYLSFIGIMLVVVLCWKYRKHKKIWLAALFYLITISLVLQLVPVGNQLTTDRYIYLPMVGLLIGLSPVIEKIKGQKIFYSLFAIPFILALMSFERVKIWENDQLIWEDVLQTYPNVAQAHNNLGSYALSKGKAQEAFNYYNRAIQLKPYYADAYSNRGNLYSQGGNSEAALADFDKAIRLRPHADAYFNRANEYAKLGKLRNAISDYSKSLELRKSADVFTNRAFVFLKQGNLNDSKTDLTSALKLNPNFDRAFFLLGIVFQQEGNKNEACSNFLKAMKLGNANAKAAHKKAC